MGASLELSARNLLVEVGGEASLEVTVRNTGTVIDELSLSLLGPAAAWSTVEPSTLSLLPGSEGTAVVTLRPPRSAAVPAGRSPFGIMAASREDPDGSIVEEGMVEVTRLVEIAAELSPRTSRGQREGTHDLAVSNRGNAPITVDLAASDPGDLLFLTVTPARLVIEPGASASARVAVQARWELEQTSPQTIPFKVTVTPEGDAATTIDGAFLQEPKEQPAPAPAEAPATTPPPAPTPPRPNQLPKVLAGLAALALLAGGVAAVATGALPIGAAEGDETTTTASPDTTGATTTTTPETTIDAADPQDVIPEIRASRTAGPSEDGAGEPITFDAENMLDGDEATAWRAPGDGRGVTITLTWPEPVRIRQIGLIPGWSFTDPNSGDDRFAQNRTIETVSWRFRPQGAERQDFEAEPELQVIDVDVVATSATLRILSTRPAEQGGREFTAISEIVVR